MSNLYEFFCPVKIVAGHAALEHISYELGALGASRPLLITDPGVRRAGLLEALTRALEEGGTPFVATFEDVPPDSSTHVVSACARVYRENRCDAIIAVGGGSVMDTSKGVNILVSENAERLEPFAGHSTLKRALKPLFAVPTTAGTGSEVTLAAVIANPDTQVKLLFVSPFILPNAAVLDPRMTMTLPPLLTAATAMDAMTHAVEAFTCRQKNPLSDAYATAAIKKVAENLPKVLEHPDDVNGRFELAQAATMAGIAFSSSMTGLVHALGHTLGATAHIHHGACMSLFLPYVLEHNLPAISRELGELLLPLEGADAYARTPLGERGKATIASLRRLRDNLYSRTKLPRTLAETGKVKREQLPAIARGSLDDGALSYNPAKVDYEDALAVLERAWN